MSGNVDMARYQRALDIAHLHGSATAAAQALGISPRRARELTQYARMIGLSPSNEAVTAREAGIKKLPELSEIVQDGAFGFVQQQRVLQENMRLKQLNKDLATQIAAEEDLRKLVFNLGAMEIDPPAWVLKSQQLGGSPGMPILFSSDKQFGEVVRPAEINGFNAYNVEIAEQRHRSLIESTIDISFNHEVSPKYDGIIYIRGGDEVSGEIHEELAETNELSSIPAVQRLMNLEAWSIATLADKFGKVFVVSVPGNHGRTTKKPRAKRYADLNIETLLAWMLEREFQSDKRISFLTPASGDAYFMVYNRHVLVTHGDRIGSRGGTGFIGPAATIARGMRKTIAQYSATGKPVDYMLVGHFHTTLDLGIGFSNGSPVGYSEYANVLRADPEPPQQWLLFMHPHRGITHTWKVQLGDAKAVRRVSNPFKAL